MTLPSLDEAKTQARALRVALSARGTTISHSEALEAIAVQHGAKDWNTLQARIRKAATRPELTLGAAVSGRYLGQPFTGRLVALSGPPEMRQVTIRLDKPVDTVRFESFSNLRHQIRGAIDATGQSVRRTSDGVPHLIVDLPS
ncbi:glyoxalase superfamily protein [Seohaeicola zhoushanensis]|uniref:Glyoxalase-related protein domain-containing protein n=1 Tax=Seohaeicola zhoushanensis TaxID=1569283 RepID=A0A8J3GZL1_9RHOB|nr:glyoxalase superfamily protein [Seohaeicola zhoushanensis]GHF59022.1 hypothetical protein GCM10017056_33110 [Seohaeicola zhoushanensis]